MSNWSDCNTCSSSIVIPEGEKGDPGSSSAGVIDVTSASYTLDASQTGSTVLLDRAAGSDITLPTTPVVGTYYDFVVTTSVTSNDYSVNLGSAGENFNGFLYGDKAATASELFTPSALGTSMISMNGTTTGGLVGTEFTVMYTSANYWTVTGNFYGSGSLATPFS